MIVLVECYHDAALVKALGVRRRDLRHEGCKGNVVKGLRKARQDAVGLLDADPQGGGRPGELANYAETDTAPGLRLLEHRRDRSKRVIEMSPRLEEWLVGRAASCGVRLAVHDLPETARELHRNPRCDRKPGFRPFLDALLRADEAMQALQRWLRG